jgi:hypothetical protein
VREVRAPLSVPAAMGMTMMPVPVSGLGVKVGGMPGAALFQGADNLEQKPRQIVPLFFGKRGKEGLRAIPSGIRVGRGSGATLFGDGDKKIAFVLFILLAPQKTALLQFAQIFAQGSRTDMKHFLQLTLVHGISVLQQGEHMHLGVFRVSVLVMGAGHAPDGPVEKDDQIFAAGIGFWSIVKHISILLFPHTPSPCRRREKSKRSVCRRKGTERRSPPASRHAAERRAHCDLLADVSMRYAHTDTHAHARARGNNAARNAEVLQRSEAYAPPWVI